MTRSLRFGGLPRRSRRSAVALCATLLVPVGIAGCSRSSTSPAGRLTVDGQAEVTRPGEDRQEVTGSQQLRIGDRVRVRQGTAVIRMPDDRLLELRLETDVELQAAEGADRVRPVLMAGDLLVVSPARPLALGATGADVAVQGDARISRGLALLVAAYKGAAQLSSGGSTLNVPALRQAALPATGEFPSRLSPLEYSAADPWDQRYLSDAIELGNQLTARSEGFTAQLAPDEGRTFNYFRDLSPRLAAEPGFTAALVTPSRAPGETLVGAAITLEGTRGSFAERWAAVFGFRDEGAPWGLVALDQGVSRVALIQTIEGDISRRPNMFAEGPPGGSPSSLPPGSGGSPATTTVRPRTSPTTAPPRPRPGAPATTTTAPPPTTPPPPGSAGPLNTGAPLVDTTVNSLVNTLTGLLESLARQ